METIWATPERLTRTMCQVMAYWTSMVPNSETVWLARNSMAFPRHLG
jgi:hypothetical protein